jgi:adenosylcobinamide kinase/adenosylcobinamide-phosphate guanylyltransferase
VEESLRPSSALRSLGEFGGTVILECLTLLVTNIILSAMEHGEEDPSVLERAVLGEVDAILSAVAESRFRLIAVTNEVGLGLVPDNRVGRIFRDIAGLANQRMASAASSVHLVISGIPVQIKG